MGNDFINERGSFLKILQLFITTKALPIMNFLEYGVFILVKSGKLTVDASNNNRYLQIQKKDAVLLTEDPGLWIMSPLEFKPLDDLKQLYTYKTGYSKNFILKF